MRPTKLLALLAIPLLSSPAFAEDALSKATEQVIYHGFQISPLSSAWKSSVNLRFDGFLCTGVFIESDVILTAAHCDIKNNAFLNIQLYKEDNPEKSTTLRLTGDEYYFRANPHYVKSRDSDPGTDDIAIVVLRNKRIPEGFAPANFQTSDISAASDPGQTVSVVGTGMTDKKKIAARLLGAQGHIDSYLNGEVMKVTMDGTQGVCGGDSGGPVFVEDEGKLFLSSITIAQSGKLSDACGNTLYATVITAKRYNWIMRNARPIRAAFTGP